MKTVHIAVNASAPYGSDMFCILKVDDDWMALMEKARARLVEEEAFYSVAMFTDAEWYDYEAEDARGVSRLVSEKEIEGLKEARMENSAIYILRHGFNLSASHRHDENDYYTDTVPWEKLDELIKEAE